MKVCFTVVIILLSWYTGVSQVREPFMNQPPRQWPQIALTNHIIYKNGDRYIHPSFAYAGTGFLVNTGTDTVAVSAKHILLIARNRRTQSVTINKDLQLWSMKPKGNTTDSVVIDQLLNEDPTEVIEGTNSTILERDIIVMSVKSASRNIHALRPRYSPVRPGEKVYFVSSAYADNTTSVIEGTVVNKYGLDILVNTYQMPQPGASGSPLIDANGWLVGVFSSVSTDNKLNKDVAVAISTEYLKDALSKKPNLNRPKLDYSDTLVKITLHSGPDAAINEYRRLTAYPHLYYVYNLRSPTKNGLREAGEKLLALDQVEEAIEILKFNAEINGAYYGNHNVLAKAYLRAGKIEEAKREYRISINLVNDAIVNDAFAELRKLENR
jgi:hypothetical protein